MDGTASGGRTGGVGRDAVDAVLAGVVAEAVGAVVDGDGLGVLELEVSHRVAHRRTKALRHRENKRTGMEGMKGDGEEGELREAS